MQLALAGRGGGHNGFNGHWMFAILGALWIVIGVVQVGKPDISFQMRRWQYRDPEAMQPSDRFLRVTRIAGIVIALAGVGKVIAALATV